ncbi:MAG TPA: hypothetical protein VMF55_03930 [Solirubrobacterales bacterium]|nr:hypothetical protein [Solirubrobacterales bacterium]
MAKTTTGEESVTADELIRLREENLRLRDLLIAKDAELGSLKGQVAALEAGTARLLNLVGRIRSLIPGPLAKALASALRRLLPRG